MKRPMTTAVPEGREGYVPPKVNPPKFGEKLCTHKVKHLAWRNHIEKVGGYYGT